MTTTREEAAARVDAMLEAWCASTADGKCSTCGAVLERSSDPELIEQYRTDYLAEGDPAPATVSVIDHSENCAILAGYKEALALMLTWEFKAKLRIKRLPDGSYYSECMERAPD